MPRPVVACTTGESRFGIEQIFRVAMSLKRGLNVEAKGVVYRQVRVTPADGLHLRPLQLLVRKALTFSSTITLTFDGRRADVKSAFDLMLLAAPTGAILSLETSGSDAAAAADAISELFETGFSISGSEVR